MRIRVNKAVIHIQELANIQKDSVTSRSRTNVSGREKTKLVWIRGIAGSRDRNREAKVIKKGQRQDRKDHIRKGEKIKKAAYVLSQAHR